MGGVLPDGLLRQRVPRAVDAKPQGEAQGQGAGGGEELPRVQLREIETEKNTQTGKQSCFGGILTSWCGAPFAACDTDSAEKLMGRL